MELNDHIDRYCIFGRDWLTYNTILCTTAFKTKSVVQQFSTNYAGKKVIKFMGFHVDGQ